MAEAFDFEFNQDMAFQNSVVKDQIDEEVFVSDENAFLLSLETETVAEFQKEGLQFVDKLLL